MIRKIFIVLFLLILFTPAISFAQEPLNDWEILDFKSEINVTENSEAEITETIVANCGDLPDKHGIFRVLPTRTNIDDGTKINYPINLISITDENYISRKFEESRDQFSHTITWKIGDPSVTVRGENTYIIKYTVGNAIRHQTEGDEFYWNLSGNFWQIPIHNFSAEIKFPKNLNIDKDNIWLYAGKTGNTNEDTSSYEITNSNTIVVRNTELGSGEGTTISINFPPSSFIEYKFSFWELYKNYIIWFLFAVILIINILLWNKFGRDPKLKKSVVPEFSIPENLDPLTMGAIDTQGGLHTHSIPAALINFATKKLVKIEETPAKGIFQPKSYVFKDISNSIDKNKLTQSEKKLFNIIFSGHKEVLFPELKKNFTTNQSELSNLGTDLRDELKRKGLMDKSTDSFFHYSKVMRLIICALVFIITYILYYLASLNFSIILALSLSLATTILFMILSPRYTSRGAELDLKIEGFKLFIKTAEKYRAQFQEKEGIFEKYLPYAILFGLTKIWIKNIKNIYGEKYLSTHPLYFYANSTGAVPDFDSLSSAINGISSSVSSSTGAGGGGSSGGGGGGGGGGGW